MPRTALARFGRTGSEQGRNGPITKGNRMLNITLSPEAVAKLQGLLKEEDNEDAVLRIREVKVGSG